MGAVAYYAIEKQHKAYKYFAVKNAYGVNYQKSNAGGLNFL